LKENTGKGAMQLLILSTILFSNITWLTCDMHGNKMADKLKITLVKSTIGAIPKHRRTVEALGLKKLNKTVEMQDNAAVRGMVQQVKHLVKVEEI